MNIQEQRMDTRGHLHSDIEEYIELCRLCDLDNDYIEEDLIDVIYDATEGKINLNKMEK